MPENKTKATEASVEAFLDSLVEDRRADAEALIKIMKSLLRQKPKMWGASIIGFGSHHYRYDSGREGDMPLICFSPRKSATVVYNMGSSDKALLEKLGKHKLAGSCLHIKSMSQIDSTVLKTLIASSLTKTQTQAK